MLECVRIKIIPLNVAVSHFTWIYFQFRCINNAFIVGT